MTNLIYEPTIKVVAETKFNEDELANWAWDNGYGESLRDTIEPTPLTNIFYKTGLVSDDESEAQLLPEFAGRFCYRAFEKGRPTADYLKNIIEMQHGSVMEHTTFSFAIQGVSRSLSMELIRHRAGCLAGDTLIYSDKNQKGMRNGTKKRTIKQIFKMNDTKYGRSGISKLRLRCLDEKTGEFTTGRVKRVFEQGIKPIYKITLNDGKVINCTSDHRFMTKEGWKPISDIVGIDFFDKSGVVHSLDGNFEVATNGIKAYKDKDWLRQKYHIENLSQEEIGVLCGVSKHTVRAWVKKNNLQKEAGSWTIGVSPWNLGKNYKFSKYELSEEGRKVLSLKNSGENNWNWKGGIRTSRHGSAVTRNFVFDREGGKCIKCNSDNNLEYHHIIPHKVAPALGDISNNIVLICEGCHKEVTKDEEHYENYFFAKIGCKEDYNSYKIGSYQQKNNKLLPKYTGIASVMYKGEEMTYDIEMLDQNNPNFVANGIIVHNCSISQESQRYVDAKDIQFVVPPLLINIKNKTGKTELISDFEEDCVQALENYIKFQEDFTQKENEDISIKSQTSLKKRANEAARALLPNAAETRFVWTANLRTLRHFCELRGGEGADLEIRRLAVEITKIMKQKAPMVFFDFEIVKGDYGVDVVKCINHKV